VHECLGGLHMASVGLDSHLPEWKSTHNWLPRLTIELDSLLGSKRPQTRPSG